MVGGLVFRKGQARERARPTNVTTCLKGAVADASRDVCDGAWCSCVRMSYVRAIASQCAPANHAKSRARFIRARAAVWSLMVIDTLINVGTPWWIGVIRFYFVLLNQAFVYY